MQSAGLWRPREERAVTRPIRRGYVDVAHGQMHYAACGDDDATRARSCCCTDAAQLREYAAVLPLIGARRRAIAVDTAASVRRIRCRATPASRRGTGTLERSTRSRCPRQLVGHHTGGVIAVELAARAADPWHR